MAETEPGAVGQRGEDSGEDRKLAATAWGWSAVLGAGGPGQQAVPWEEGQLRPLPTCWVAQGEGPGLRAMLLGCSSAQRPTGGGPAGLSFISRAAPPAAPGQQAPGSLCSGLSAFLFFKTAVVTFETPLEASFWLTLPDGEHVLPAPLPQGCVMFGTLS